jgi:hypothetical protein
MLPADMGGRRHGMHNTRIYRVWCGMRRRCYWPKTRQFEDYGGRGIKVCDRWLECFENFFEDMGPSYKEGLTLDRCRVNEDYGPNNCRWATRKEQANNTRVNVFLETPKGRMRLAEAAQAFDIPAQRIYRRLWDGWSINRALEWVGDGLDVTNDAAR